MAVNYVIISEPSYITCTCSHCNKDIEVPFDEVHYNSDYWGDGGYCWCPECGEEVELGDYDYD